MHIILGQLLQCSGIGQDLSTSFGLVKGLNFRCGYTIEVTTSRGSRVSNGNREFRMHIIYG
jgi:hypothetical protein